MPTLDVGLPYYAGVMQEIAAAAASQVNPRTPMLTAKLTVTVSGCHDLKRYLKALIHTLQVHAKPAATNECSVIENAPAA